MPKKPMSAHHTLVLPSGPASSAPATRMKAKRPVSNDPIPILTTSEGSRLRLACHAHSATSGGTATTEANGSIELNHDGGTPPHGVDRLTCWSTHNTPMLQIIG